VVLLDTAGRTTLDEEMMAEATAVKSAAQPHEVLLVADSLTGQDAVNLARAFDTKVGLTGIVLTRVDGDGRGGAALSMRAVTGKPIKLIGTGEKTDALEDFHPSRIAGRILGMGDVVSLVEKAAAHIDAEKAARVAEKMRKGQFDLNDMRDQLQQMQHGRHRRVDGHDARHRQDEEPDRRRRHRRQESEASDRDHRFDDAAGRKHPDILKPAAKSASPPAPGRRSRTSTSCSDAPQHGRHDEDDGIWQERPDGRHRPGHGFWRRRNASAEQMKAMATSCPKVRTACRNCQGPSRRPARRIAESSRLTGITGKPTLPASAAFPASARRRNETRPRNAFGVIVRAGGRSYSVTLIPNEVSAIYWRPPSRA